MATSHFDPKQNYYDILDVDKNSPPEEITKAYHQLAKKYHPDRNFHPQAEERMKAINTAYETLSDKQSRATYDLTLPSENNSVSDKNHASYFEHSIFKDNQPSPSSYINFNTAKFGNRRRYAEEKRDFDEAIKIAQVYFNTFKHFKTKNTHHPYYEKSDYAHNQSLSWLLKAIEFKSHANDDISNYFNIKHFLETFTTLHSLDIFSNAIKSDLLEPLILNTSITKIRYGASLSNRDINKNLAHYLIKTKTLKTLDLSLPRPPEDHERIAGTPLAYVAYGLRFNRSIETLDLSSQPIYDDGLMTLLDGLSKNPNSRLSNLHLPNTEITNNGVKALIQYLQKNHTLENISLFCNPVSQVYVDEIGRLTQRNKQHNQKIWTLQNYPRNLFDSRDARNSKQEQPLNFNFNYHK